MSNIIAWIAANALDAAATYVGLQSAGVEASPLPAFILARFGATALWALKACLTLALPVATLYLARRYPYAEDYGWRLMGLSTAVVALAGGRGFYLLAMWWCSVSYRGLAVLVWRVKRPKAQQLGFT